MEKLLFSTGLKEFELPGGQILSFIPTDPALMKRIYNAFESLNQRQEEYKETEENPKAFFEYVEKLDEEMQATTRQRTELMPSTNPLKNQIYL